jgi:hypothetical protein
MRTVSLMRSLAIAVAVFSAATVQLSCSINDYCLNCFTGDGGDDGDGGLDDGGAGDDGGGLDAGCVPTGEEICDGKDNDCNGLIDDGVLPGVGDLCTNQLGECAGGVQECVNGVLRCSKQPSPEVCDNLDNNCNGMVDEGDPGGGAKCGTDVGECVAGVERCQNGEVVCVGAIGTVGGQPEICDAKDNDCDGKFDEDIDSFGDCGPSTNVGRCQIGQLMCQAGTPVCMGAVFPIFEICNGEDDDCDGEVDEIFNFDADPFNCGGCGSVCPQRANAIPTCSPSAGLPGSGCGITCLAGYHNLDNDDSTGCDYGPCFPTGEEVCDGIDNDCDGEIDEDVVAPPICLQGGECGNAVASCSGAGGWTCNYPSTVQFPETACDGLDNDCDTRIDEGQPNLGQDCDDGRQGVCRGTGTFVCDTANVNGPAVCDVTNPGQAVPDAVETCDNLDNDCDGKIDEGADTGNLLGQVWIDIGGGKQMMKFEASRRDAEEDAQGSTSTIVVAPIAAAPGGATQSGATATFTTTAAHGLAGGTKVRISGVAVGGYNGIWTVASTPTPTTFTAVLSVSGLGNSGGGTVSRYFGACSKPGVLPWTNVTYPEALAVCESMGASLCTEPQWHGACSVVTPETYPIAVPAGGFTRKVEAEHYFARTSATHGGTLRTWVPDSTPGFHGFSALRADPNTGGNTTTAADAVAGGPRLDFQFDMAAAGSYRACVRAFSPNANDNEVWLRISADPTTGTGGMESVATASNNSWVVIGMAGTVAVSDGTNYVSVYMKEDGIRIDQVYLTTGACPAATVADAGGKWAYAMQPDIYQPATCNGEDFDPNSNALVPTGSLPACYANHGGDGPHDLSGNVKEWTLARLPGQNPLRGGASNNLADGISCPLSFTLANDQFFFPNVGFRCCRNAP